MSSRSSSQVFNIIEEYAPGFKSSIVGKEVLTPPDIEKTFGLTGGVSIFSQFFFVNLSLSFNYYGYAYAWAENCRNARGAFRPVAVHFKV